MDIAELEEFLARVKEKLDHKFPTTEKKLRIMSQTVKLSEEVGELSEQILLWSGGHVSDKGAHNAEDLADEIADVIISTGTIAHELGIPLAVALEQKMQKIKIKWGA